MYIITIKEIPKITRSYEFVDLNKMGFLKGSKSTGLESTLYNFKEDVV